MEPKSKWKVFAGVPDEGQAHVMCSFLRSAGLHPVIERSDALAHYGIASLHGCRVLLPEDEHALALEAYAKVVVLPPNSAEEAFESSASGTAPNSSRAGTREDSDEDRIDWEPPDPEAWKQAVSAIRRSAGLAELEQEVVPDTGSRDPEDMLDIPREQWTQRERDADDAFDLVRVGMYGVLAMPRVLYLLWRVRRSSERLRPSLRSKAIRATWLCVPFLLIFFVLIPTMILLVAIRSG